MAISDWQKTIALRLLRGGAPAFRVGEEVGIAGSSVCRLARLYGIPLRKRGGPKGLRAMPAEVREKALRRIEEGATLREAGKAAGVSHEAVNLWAKQEEVIVRRSREGWAKIRKSALAMSRAGVPDRVINERLNTTAAGHWRRMAGA